MAWTSHGHHIPGTPITWDDAPKMVARCGGPGLCKTCSTPVRPTYTTHISFKQTGSIMEFKTFVRKPFTVEAVEVTEENIEQIAEYVGTLRHKEDGTPYIQVNRRLVPNIYRVYPGFWMTKMGDNIRCYSKRIFTEQFTPMTPEIGQWVDFMHGEKKVGGSE